MTVQTRGVDEEHKLGKVCAVIFEGMLGVGSQLTHNSYSGSVRLLSQTVI